jgi:hypothetical protein
MPTFSPEIFGDFGSKLSILTGSWRAGKLNAERGNRVRAVLLPGWKVKNIPKSAGIIPCRPVSGFFKVFD